MGRCGSPLAGYQAKVEQAVEDVRKERSHVTGIKHESVQLVVIDLSLKDIDLYAVSRDI